MMADSSGSSPVRPVTAVIVTPAEISVRGEVSSGDRELHLVGVYGGVGSDETRIDIDAQILVRIAHHAQNSFVIPSRRSAARDPTTAIHRS